MASPIPHCRICGQAKLEPILSLGDMPPVNSFLSGPADIAKATKAPLAIAFCATCSHGRPTAILLSHSQLEREFSRR